MMGLETKLLESYYREHPGGRGGLMRLRDTGLPLTGSDLLEMDRNPGSKIRLHRASTASKSASGRRECITAKDRDGEDILYYGFEPR